MKKTSNRGLSKFLSQIFRRSAAPDNSLTKQTTGHRPHSSIKNQATDHWPHSSITKQATDNLWKQMWIRRNPDEDGYFLLQIDDNNMFLTAEDAFSLTIACK